MVRTWGQILLGQFLISELNIQYPVKSFAPYLGGHRGWVPSDSLRKFLQEVNLLYNLFNIFSLVCNSQVARWLSSQNVENLSANINGARTQDTTNKRASEVVQQLGGHPYGTRRIFRISVQHDHRTKRNQMAPSIQWEVQPRVEHCSTSPISSPPTTSRRPTQAQMRSMTSPTNSDSLEIMGHTVVRT